MRIFMIFLAVLIVITSYSNSWAACASYSSSALSGMTTLGKVDKIQTRAYSQDPTKLDIIIYFSSLKTAQGATQTCISVRAYTPGNDIVSEWARMATVAMTLNYDLNVDTNGTGELAANSGKVELVRPSTP